MSSAQHSEATIETINNKRGERREKRLLTPKASYFPWTVFQLQMEALSDSVAQLFSKRTSSEIYCRGTCFLLICLAHHQRMCACVISAFTCSLLWQCYIGRHVEVGTTMRLQATLTAGKGCFSHMMTNFNPWPFASWLRQLQLALFSILLCPRSNLLRSVCLSEITAPLCHYSTFIQSLFFLSDGVTLLFIYCEAVIQTPLAAGPSAMFAIFPPITHHTLYGPYTLVCF